MEKEDGSCYIKIINERIESHTDIDIRRPIFNLIEATLDMQEGADFLMVKPALAYLDVIKLLKDHIDLPIAAYNVSGEYSMIKAAAQKGWINEQNATFETLMGIKRAGADVILSYHAKEVIAKNRI